MGILNAIGGLFSGAVKSVEDLASKAWDAVKSVFLFTAGIFDLVGGAWQWMVNGIGWLGDNLIGAAARVLHLLEWLALQALPEGLHWALTKAVGWARTLVHDARTFLEHLIHGLIGWLHGLINTLRKWATDAFRYVWNTLSQAWHFIETAGKRVADLVLHPEKLVKWILAALIWPLVEWMIKESAALIVWLAKRATGVMHDLAHTLEDALSKIV